MPFQPIKRKRFKETVKEILGEDIPTTSKVLLLYLVAHNSGNQPKGAKVEKSMADIVGETGLAEGTVRKARVHLRENGYIRWEPSVGGTRPAEGTKKQMKGKGKVVYTISKGVLYV